MKCAINILGDVPIKNVMPDAIESVVVTLQERGWKPASVSSIYLAA